MTPTLQSLDAYNQLQIIKSKTQTINERYQHIYRDVHQERFENISEAVDKIKGDPEWGNIDESNRNRILMPLTSRVCDQLEFNEKGTSCRNCKAGFAEMKSDLLAIGQLITQARNEMYEFSHPDEVEQVKVYRLVQGLIETEEDIDRVLEELSKRLRKLLAEGKKIELG